MRPEDISMNIAKNLKYLRKKKKLTQEDVINDIGDFNLSLRSYKTYESGKGDMPSLEKLVLLADYYNCSIDFLIRGTEVTYDNSFMLSDNMKRLGQLIYSMCLVPYDAYVNDECKYAFVSYDKEIELFVNKLFEYSAKTNYEYDYKGKAPKDIIDNYIEFANEYKKQDEDQSPTLERANRIISISGESPNVFFERRLNEHNKKLKSRNKI